MNKILKLALIGAGLALLTACGDTTSQEDTTSHKSLINDATTEETSAKTLENYKLAFQFGEDAEELPSYVYAFVSGSFNGWKENFDISEGAEYKLEKAADSEENVYFANIGDVSEGETLEFKVIMGTSATMIYNEETALYKVGWAYEASINGANIGLTATEGEPAVSTLKKYAFPANPDSETFTVTFITTINGYDAEEHGDYIYGYKGSWDGWEYHLAENNEGVISVTIEGIFAGTYEFGLNVEKPIGEDQYEWLVWLGNAEVTISEDTTFNFIGTMDGDLTPVVE